MPTACSEEPGRRPTKKQAAPRPAQRKGGSAAGKGAAPPPGAVAHGKSPAAKGAAGKSNKPSGAESAGQSSGEAGAQFVKAGGAPRALALGYTILMKDDTGRLFVADPRHEF